MIGMWAAPAPEREECPVHGCRNGKPDRQIMCSPCYAAIPRKARDLVEKSFGKRRDAPRKYTEACKSAIAAAQAVRS